MCVLMRGVVVCFMQGVCRYLEKIDDHSAFVFLPHKHFVSAVIEANDVEAVG